MATNNEFKVGDVVLLKSGGPQMTIQSINEDGSFNCVWIDKNRVYDANFPAILLEYPADFTGFFGSV